MTKHDDIQFPFSKNSGDLNTLINRKAAELYGLTILSKKKDHFVSKIASLEVLRKTFNRVKNSINK